MYRTRNTARFVVMRGHDARAYPSPALPLDGLAPPPALALALGCVEGAAATAAEATFTPAERTHRHQHGKTPPHTHCRATQAGLSSLTCRCVLNIGQHGQHKVESLCIA
jgi:hypothetical protein